MKILFVTSGAISDYLNDALFHGLKIEYGRDVFETNDLWYMYKGLKVEDRKLIYGRGFSLYGNLDPDLRNVEDQDIVLERIKSHFYDLIIYGSIHRYKPYLTLVLKYYRRNQIVFIDGEDETSVIKELVKVGVYFKRELISLYGKLDILPIGFAIPDEKIIDYIPRKTKEWASIIPGKKSTYNFFDEESYYNDYQTSKYAITTKKGGWDCLRHYEILANGCLPYFPDLEDCDSLTLTRFPKELVLSCNKLIERKQFTDELYFERLNILLNWTKNNLTTVELARYVTSQLKNFENENAHYFEKPNSQKSFDEGINFSSYILESTQKILFVGIAAGSHVRRIRNSTSAEIWYIDQIKSTEPLNCCDYFYYGTIKDNLDNLAKRYFDCIILSDSLEKNPDTDFLLRQLRDKLSDKGIIICKFPNLRYFVNIYTFLVTKKLEFRLPGIGYSINHMLFSTNSMDQLFVDCGFSCELTQGINPYLSWKWTLLNKLLFNSIADTRYEFYLKVFKLQP